MIIQVCNVEGQPHFARRQHPTYHIALRSAARDDAASNFHGPLAKPGSKPGRSRTDQVGGFLDEGVPIGDLKSGGPMLAKEASHGRSFGATTRTS